MTPLEIRLLAACRQVRTDFETQPAHYSKKEKPGLVLCRKAISAAERQEATEAA
jgi:hypothetical protein